MLKKAAHKEDWFSFHVYYDKLEKVLTNVIRSFNEESTDLYSNFIFQRSFERGQNMVLIYRTSPQKFETKLKPKLLALLSDFLTAEPATLVTIKPPVNDWFLPVQNNVVLVNSNFTFDIMETGGLSGSKIAERLLCYSSNLLLDFFNAEQGEWDPDEAFGLALQLQISLASSFFTSINSLHHFYSYVFDRILEMAHLDAQEVKNIAAGLDENFSAQKENILGYVNFISDSSLNQIDFEEPWLNEWNSICSEVSKDLNTITENGDFFPPENFSANEEIKIPLKEQEFWPIVEYYTRAINSQIGIVDGSEINIIYTLKQSFAEICKTSINGA